jgi:hypothetical protein
MESTYRGGTMRVRVSYHLPGWGRLPAPPKRRSRFWDWSFDELLEALIIEAKTGRMPGREELSGHA